MTASRADYLSLRGEGGFLVIEREGGPERIDLSNVDSVDERDTTIVIRGKDGGETGLSLTCTAARADSLYQFVEWAHPVLRKEIQQIIANGATLKPLHRPPRGEILGFLIEVAAAVLFAIFVYHFITVLAAIVFVALRARTRWALRARGSETIQFHPAPSGGFAHLSKGKQQFSLEHATFDVGAWGKGLAVVTDGTLQIRLPIGEVPGAFLLFATLLDICGSPDDRLVD